MISPGHQNTTISKNGRRLYDDLYNLSYRISRPIRRTLIFSLEILEKIIMNVF